MQANGYCHFNDKKVNRQFHISLFGHELSIQQMPDDRLLGHGAVVWDSAAIFVKYMECNPKDYDSSKLAGKTVLELGPGCGLAGIAFMMRGAVVTCTDLSDVTIALTMKNVNVSSSIPSIYHTIPTHSDGMMIVVTSCHPSTGNRTSTYN